MSAAVDTDNMRYQKQLDADETKQEMLEARFNELFNRYWNEYLQTARIEDLDWNTEDLEVLSQEQEKTFREIIYNECAQIILITWD